MRENSNTRACVCTTMDVYIPYMHECICSMMGDTKQQNMMMVMLEHIYIYLVIVMLSSSFCFLLCCRLKVGVVSFHTKGVICSSYYI